MKKSTHFFGFLLIIGSVVLMSVGLSSCSSSKGTLACPAFHKGNSGTFAMLRKYHHIIKASNTAKHDGGRTSAHINPDSILLRELPGVESLTDKGTASVSDEVPTRESAIEKFSKLDREERDEAKKAIESSLSKRPFLKRMALNKFAKIDEKYPAPAHHSDGGGMGTGEILSIVAIVLAFLFPIVGLILGIVALIVINNNGGAGWARTLAIIAIIVGAILTLVVAGVIVIIR